MTRPVLISLIISMVIWMSSIVVDKIGINKDSIADNKVAITINDTRIHHVEQEVERKR